MPGWRSVAVITWPDCRAARLMDIGIAGGKISAVARSLPAADARRTISAKGWRVRPGPVSRATRRPRQSANRPASTPTCFRFDLIRPGPLSASKRISGCCSTSKETPHCRDPRRPSGHGFFLERDRACVGPSSCATMLALSYPPLEGGRTSRRRRSNCTVTAIQNRPAPGSVPVRNGSFRRR